MLAPGSKIAILAHEKSKKGVIYFMTDLNKIIDELSKLTVVEAAELSKQLEEKWGVSAGGASSSSSSISGSTSRRKI